MIFAQISSSITNWISFQFRITSFCFFALHFLLIYLTWKWPQPMCLIHSPILVLLMVPSMLWFIPGQIDNVALGMLPTIAGLFMTLLCGFMTNGCWILTTCSMLMAASAVFSFFYIVYGFFEPISTFEVVATIVMMALQMYRTELADKRDFLSYSQIEQMNEELHSILLNLPEGIVLVDILSQQISLIN